MTDARKIGLAEMAIATAYPVLLDYAKEAGPCDHAVNVCVCGIREALELLDRASRVLNGTLDECWACGGAGFVSTMDSEGSRIDDDCDICMGRCVAEPKEIAK